MIKRNFEPGFRIALAPEGSEPRAAGRAQPRRQPAEHRDVPGTLQRRGRGRGRGVGPFRHGARARTPRPPRDRPGGRRGIGTKPGRWIRLCRRSTLLRVEGKRGTTLWMSGRCCGDMFDAAMSRRPGRCSCPPTCRRRRRGRTSSSAPARPRRRWPAQSRPTGRRIGRSAVLSSRAMAMASDPCRASRSSRPPIPSRTRRDEAAAARILDLVRSLGPDDLVLCLISGGGSRCCRFLRRESRWPTSRP